ncbi:uncharacterized protein C10orf67 homolog, mitochondrial [Nannospalax galili]|uniref:uncharacterized protein C10orf67 homolog, mitochondrial n=1 Tax=Nannospalax galili TaxID=1026970 RepID=UPI00111C4117|nr:uncharacterized protein C10orf67 homolog, mitochondrial [Nannospalax galili]
MAASENSEDLPGIQACRRILETIGAAIEQFQFSPRLTISDNLKVGFFTSDHATQTDCSEIVPLQDLSLSTQELMKMIKSLQVDFGFLKDLIQLKFEDRLREESWNVVSSLNDRIKDMQKIYRQAEDSMRKSFQQQLTDAIAIIKGMYKRYFDMEAEKAALQDAASSKMNFLARKLREKEELLKELKEEMAACEELGFYKTDSSTKEPSSPKPEKDTVDYKQENERLLQVIADLREEVQMNMKENAMLEDELICLKEIAEQDQRTIQKLMDSRDTLRYELDCEKLAIQDLINKQKEDIEIRRKYASISIRGMKAAKGREGSLSPWRRGRLSKSVTSPTSGAEPVRLPALSSVTPMVKEKISKKTPKQEKLKVTFTLPEMIPEEPAEKVKQFTDEEKSLLEHQVETLKTTLENQKRKMDRFRKEADQINKNWERKFHILRNSFHVLKDEMFTRHTLFRQFVMIADTSFNYIKVKPLYVHATETSSSTSVFHSPLVEHKFVEIASDQSPFASPSKVTFVGTSRDHLEMTPVSQHTPSKPWDPQN